MPVLTKAQVAALRNVKTGLDGYVNNQFGLIKRIADSEITVSGLYDQTYDGDIPVTTTATAGVKLYTDSKRNEYLKIPTGALVKEVMFDVITAATASGGSATMDVQLIASSTVENSGVIVNDHTEANLAVGAKMATCVPQKLSADSNVYLTAGTAKFEKGKMRVFIKYYMARD